MKSIAIQDNDPEILNVLTLSFRDFGYQVLPTPCYQQLLDEVREHKPGLALLDYKFNGQEAIITCGKIKSHYPEVAVIATSCNTGIRNVYATYGFDYYLEKPFDISRLFKLTGILLAEKSRLRLKV